MTLLEGLLEFAQFQMQISIVSLSQENISEFESHHCFDKHYQKYFTQDYLRKFIERDEQGNVHLFTDQLGMCGVYLQIEKDHLFFGPFADKEWKNDTQGEELLAKLGIPAANYLPCKFYRAYYPVLSVEAVASSAEMIANLVLQKKEPLQSVTHNLSGSGARTLTEQYESRSDLTELRYSLEDQFSTCVEEGDAEGAIKAWDELGGLKKDFKFNQYMQTMGVAIGHTILRTLTRRAVLRAGVQPGEIDYVTQMYALKMYTANNRQSHKMLQVRFLHDMCQLVNRYKTQAYTSLIRGTIKYIEMNLSNDLSLDVLAENTGTSKARLSRRFKEEKELTINQFIAKARMEKAAELLISSRLSIQDISTYVGYLDGNYFVKVFKKQYGMPPSIYRKQHA